MKNYIIYSKGKEVKFCENKFSFLSLVFGPLIFVYHGFWKNFFVFMTILFAIALMVEVQYISFSLYLFLYSILHLYLAIDYSNIYERFLISKGFKFDKRVLAFSLLEAESVYGG
jgi:hypothetical protein